MSRKWIVPLLLLSLLAASPAFPKSKEKVSSPLRHTPSITRETLDNGLTVLLKEVHRAPLVSVMAYVKTGSAHEGDLTGSGVSHVVEHMLFKGTETRGVGEIDRAIRSYGGDMNAFTSHDVTGYSLVVNRTRLNEALSVLADCLMHAKFDEGEFAKEKEVVLKEVRLNHDSPARRTADLLWQNAYQVHPYRHPVIGYESLLKNLTREETVRYYRERYLPNNMVLAIVGDIRSSEALKFIEEHFGPFERGRLSPEPLVREPVQVGVREVREEAEIQIAHLVMGYHTVDFSDKAMYPLDLLAILLGEGESSRLVRVLQKEKELVFSIGTSHYSPKDPGLFTISALLEENKIPEALKAIREEIEKMKHSPVSKKELKKAKRGVLSHYYFGRETIQSQAGELAENEILASDPLFSERYVEGIESVEAEDIQRVAEAYLGDENLTRVTLAPQSPPKTAEGAEPESSQGKPIERHLLPNGLRLLLQKETTQPTVSIGIAHLGGLLFEDADHEGISNFLSQMLIKGTATKDEKEISEWIDGHGALLSPFSGQNSFGLRLKVLKEDAVEGLHLLKELMFDSTFPKEQLEKERKQILTALRVEQDQIFKVGGRLLRKTLYTSHPYRFHPLGTEKTISRLSREDLVAFYQRLLSSERMVVTVFGDIEVEKIVEEVQKAFLRFPARSGKRPQLPLEPPLEEPRFVTERLPKEQAVVLVGFHGISLLDKDYYVFEVLTNILSGGGGKLHFEIRDKGGQAYTLGAYPVWGLDPGHYVFYVATTEQELPSVQEKLLAEIEVLRDTPIPSEEIQRAKESLIGLQKLSLETPEDLSFQVALDELYGLGHLHYLDYEEKIRSVTAEDLQRVASTYFEPQKKAVILLLPQEAQKKESP